MELVTPEIGLLFWMTISFLTLMFLLKKFAWKPILGALKEREDSIEDALKQAKKAKKEMEKLHASNENLLEEAKAERNEMIKEARELKDGIVAEAKEKAKPILLQTLIKPSLESAKPMSSSLNQMSTAPSPKKT